MTPQLLAIICAVAFGFGIVGILIPSWRSRGASWMILVALIALGLDGLIAAIIWNAA